MKKILTFAFLIISAFGVSFSLAPSTAYAACSTPAGNAGSVTYNGSQNVMQFCDDTDWIDMGHSKPAAAGTACTNPVGNEGSMFYNSTQNVAQFCNGDEWVNVANANLPGASGTACTGPTGNEGSMFYNSSEKKIQFCNGDSWVNAVHSVIAKIPFFATLLYTGDGTSPRSFSSIGFQPDFVWTKSRASGRVHGLYDVVRGANGLLQSQDTSLEQNQPEYLKSFDADGITIGNNVHINTNSENYVAWMLKAGGAATANTDGTVSSEVSANPNGAFSIVKYTGAGTDGTVGHGLPATPEMIIQKNYAGGSSNSRGWIVYHKDLTAGNVLRLDTDSAQFASAQWGTIDASTFGIRGGSNTSIGGETSIAYAFRSVPGIIDVGSYTGNGSTTGTIVNTGFKPAWIMIKPISTSQNWTIVDTARSPTNPMDDELIPNSSVGEYVGANNVMDSLDDGFQMKSSHNAFNGSGVTYLYMAIAE